MDGIPATLADGQSALDHLDIGSLGRVEVMRGPSAAMYGNGGGGVLSFQTKESPDVPVREEATAIFGENGLMRFQSTTSGTQGGMTYLVNVAHLTYDGFRTVEDSTDFAVERPDSSLYGLAARFNVNGQVGVDAAGGRLLFTANFMDLEAENPGGLNRDAIYADRSLNARGGAFGNIARNARKDVYPDTVGGGLSPGPDPWGISTPNLSHGGSAGEITIQSPRGSSISAGTPTASAPWYPTIPVTIRVPSRGAAGFDVDLQRDDRAEHDNIGGTPGTLTKDQFETVTAAGVFLQANGSAR